MISASDFRNGITIEKDGTVLEIIEFQHSALLRNSLRQGSTGKSISICMQMVIFMLTWIQRLMIRSALVRTLSATT